ncbi:hypothetical protein ABVT39_020677 [Epinephelus coioides]
MTITVTLSRPPLKHAAVGPPLAALHNQSSHSTLAGTVGQMWDVWCEMEETAAVYWTIMC